MTSDFGHTTAAQQRRQEKAQALGRWLWERGLTADDLDQADAITRRAMARAAGVNPPSSDETWRQAATCLAVLAAWAGQHPEHPAAAQPFVTEGNTWGDSARSAPQAQTGAVIDLQQRREARGQTPALAVPPDAPRGWAELVALGPLARPDAACAACGHPAVTAAQVGGHTEWRCAGHPPRPGDWGYQLDWTPRPTTNHPARPHRCHEPRCPTYALT